MTDQIAGRENARPSHFPSSYVSIILYSKNSYQIVSISAKTTNNEHDR